MEFSSNIFSSRVRYSRRSGNAGIIMTMFAAVAVIFLIVLSGPVIQTQSCAHNMLVIGPAIEISNQIKNYPTINGTDCNSLLNMISNGNNIILSINNVLGTNFDQASVSQTCSIALQFAPAVSTYDQVITSARYVNSDNATSVTNFYENIFQLAAEYFIIKSAIDAVGYKVAFAGTAELNDGLKLGKIVSLCGDSCYSDLLSRIHWFLRDNFDYMVGDFLSWATKIMQDKSC